MAEYIEREALMNEIYRIGGHNLCEWSTIGVKALVGRQPAADVVEVRHGEWADGVWRKKCSLCGFCGSLYDTPANPWNYCPNCGAKMDGKEE